MSDHPFGSDAYSKGILAASEHRSEAERQSAKALNASALEYGLASGALAAGAAALGVAGSESWIAPAVLSGFTGGIGVAEQGNAHAVRYSADLHRPASLKAMVAEARQDADAAAATSHVERESERRAAAAHKGHSAA